MEELKYRKLYIDSKNKLGGESGNNADFEITLNDTVQLPANTVAFMDDVILPVAFKNVIEGESDKLYLGETYSFNSYNHTFTLPEQNYTLAQLGTQIQTLLNTTGGDLSYTVVTDTNNLNLVVSMTDNRGSQPDTARFYLYTDSEVPGVFGVTLPNSINNILQNNVPLASTWPDQTEVLEYIPDLHTLRNIYVTSNLSNYSVITNFTWGGNTIIKKIPINVPYGNLLFNNINAAHDYFRCGEQTLHKIRFTLRDESGNLVKMKQNWSFSIIFTQE